MGLLRMSFFRRRRLRKSKKKLSESLASLDSLQTQVDETFSHETQLQLQHDNASTRLHNASEAKKALLQRIKVKMARLEKVNEDISKMDTALTKVMERNRENFDVCRQLELYHKELPTRTWRLQVQLSRTFRSIEETKRNIATASSNHHNCRDKLEIKREELLMRRIQIKSTKEKISRLKTQLQKVYDSKKIKEFYQRTLETMVLYVMQMNLRAVNSRSKMVERRGGHLENMLENMNNELELYDTLLSGLKKKKYQTRPVKTNKNLSSIDVGVV